MAFEYPIVKRNEDSTYGPTLKSNFYKPADYHKRNAKKKKGKTRWIVPEYAEYYIFKISDENIWFCNGNEKLFSLISEGREVLGENGERLALFWPPKNNAEPWHGFPIFSWNFLPSSELLDIWEKNNIINYNLRIRIETGKI